MEILAFLSRLNMPTLAISDQFNDDLIKLIRPFDIVFPIYKKALVWISKYANFFSSLGLFEEEFKKDIHMNYEIKNLYRIEIKNIFKHNLDSQIADLISLDQSPISTKDKFEEAIDSTKKT